MVIDVKKSNTYFIQGMLFLIFAQIMVGINIVFSKYVLSSIPVLYILALRFTLAAVILLLLHWLTPAKKLPMYSYFLQLKRRDWFFYFCSGIICGSTF